MKTLILKICLLILFIGTSVRASTLPRPLHVEGRQLVNDRGQVVVLRGVNHAGFSDSPDGFWDAPGAKLYSGLGVWDPEVVRTNLRDMAALGFNVVRFHTVIQWWKENPQTYKDEWRDVHYPLPYREMVKSVVQMAGEAGLYVIFDFYRPSRLTNPPPLPWPPHLQDSAIVGSRDEFKKLVLSVARELGTYPHVLIEPYNEPHGGAENEAEWFSFVQELLPPLRKLTSNPVIIQWNWGCWVNLDYPPPLNSAATLDWIWKWKLEDPNLIYSTHFYRQSGGDDSGGGMVHRSEGGMKRLWKRSDIKSALKMAGVDRFLKENSRPLLVGELGPYMRLKGEALEKELKWLENILDLLNQRHVGYLAWTWSSDQQQDHGLLHQGAPNRAGQVLVDSLK